jgi:hypothetical protein
MIAPLVLLFGTACSTPEPAPKAETKPAAPACGVDINSLDGTSWVHLKPQPAGPDKANPTARMKFAMADGKLTAKYTAGSLGDVYDYDCAINGKTATCLEKELHPEGWCHAWAATHDGVCDPAALASVLGVTPDVLKDAADKVTKEIKAIKKPDDRTAQMKADNSPNNKLRGKFLIAVDPGSCKLTVQDKYQTMVDSKINEYENVLGTAKFEKATEDYIYETCKDSDSAWAPSPSDDSKHEPVQSPGSVKFSAILQKDQKGAASCTYTADIYKDWVKVQSDVPSTDDKKYGPRWDTALPLMDAGRHAVYFDRYKTCDGKKEKIGLTCAIVRVE